MPVALRRSNSAFEWIRRLLKSAQSYSGLVTSVLLISVGSKLLGLVREVFISSHFGVSAATDSFFGVQQLPLMMMNYMAGAFTLAFVPHYVTLKAQGRSGDFLKKVLVAVAVVAAVATLTMIVGASQLVPALLGTRSESQMVARFSVVLATAVFPSAVIGIGYGVCHAEREHRKAMLLETVAPAAMLMSLLAWNCWPSANLQYALPWSYVIGTLIGAIWAAHRITIALQPSREDIAIPVSQAPAPSGLKFIQQLSAASVENIAFNINQLLTVHFAAATGAGGIALNIYALRIAMLPLSGAATPLNQIVNTWLAKQQITRQKRGFAKALILAGSAFSICALAMFLLRGVIIRVVYQRGVFSAANAASVAQVLSPYAAYFLVMALNQLFARFYFVVGKGHVYTGVLLAGYVVANALKPVGAAHFHLVGVISAAVIGEGMALLTLAILFVRYRARTCA